MGYKEDKLEMWHFKIREMDKSDLVWFIEVFKRKNNISNEVMTDFLVFFEKLLNERRNNE